MFAISINHKTAPVEIRKLFSFSEAEKMRISQALIQTETVKGCIVLSTCNRTELYFSGEYSSLKKCEKIMAQSKGLELESIIKYLNIYNGEKAISHLLKVVCGIDSMILGEDEILRQVKDAFLFAMENKFTDFELNTVFKQSVTEAKKIKTETEISKTPVSIGTLTAKSVFDFPKEEKTVLIIGITGKTGTICAKNILAKPNIKLMGTSRSHNERKIVNFSSGEAQIIPYAQRYEAMKEADVIISCTSSPHYTVIASEVKKYVSDGRKRLFIDLAVPPDIDTEICSFENVSLINIDEFNALSAENNIAKKKEAEEIALILEEKKDEIEKELYFHEFLNILPVAAKKIDKMGFEKTVYKLRKNCSREQFEAFAEAVKTVITEEDE